VRPAVFPSPVAVPRDERYDFAVQAAQAPLIRLVIADDRTQVYAIGFAEDAAAASRGADAQAASIDIAMRRCRELAADLGLRAGPLTLAVVYPRLGQGPGQITVTGVAMATTGMMPLSALRPTPPPTTTQVVQRPPTPETARPVPMTVYSPATVQPSSTTPPQSAQTAPPDPVPIDVEDVGDTLIYSGSGTLEVPADELLLTIEVHSYPRSRPGLQPQSALGTLRADPRVASAEYAFGVVDAMQLTDLYHVVVRNANPASAWNIVKVASRATSGRWAGSSFDYAGALRSCRDPGATVVRQAAHEALVGAAKSASFLGLNVRRLIFAKVDGPTTDSRRCAPDATTSFGFPDRGSRYAAPTRNDSPPTVTFHADVHLTFRAFRFGT
jgi:hypothetical protein